MIDLHMHSTFSDGTYTPEELVKKIVKKGLKAAALTDHDVVDGCLFFEKAAQNAGLLTVHGSELSVHYPKVSMEIVALDIPTKNLQAFKDSQLKMKEERLRVARERLDLLNKLGIKLSWDEIVCDDMGNSRNQVGKPHIVAAMLRHGYIKTWDEGFSCYLNKGCPAYVAKKEPEYDEVISFVAENGAVPILAHPIHTKKTGKDLFELFKELKSCGLSGVEVFHSDHDKSLKKDYLAMIEELNMITAGGSDFHGGAHPEVEIGTGKGDLNIPDMVFEVLKERNNPTGAYYSELKKSI